MSVSEGQPLTPELANDVVRSYLLQYVPGGFADEDGVWHAGPHREAAIEALDALLAELARERVAREGAESYAGDVEVDLRRSEGRVRVLEEALERIASWTEAAHTTAEVRDFAREALAGLPE